jgi:hypothetical protein
MSITKVPQHTKKEQQLLFSYFDTVFIDFDLEVDLKKIKDQIKMGNKKPGNK